MVVSTYPKNRFLMIPNEINRIVMSILYPENIKYVNDSHLLYSKPTNSYPAGFILTTFTVVYQKYVVSMTFQKTFYKIIKFKSSLSNKKQNSFYLFIHIFRINILLSCKVVLKFSSFVLILQQMYLNIFSLQSKLCLVGAFLDDLLKNLLYRLIFHFLSYLKCY